MLRAALCGERHLYRDVLLIFGHGVETDLIDEAEIHDVDRDLRVVALLERAENIFLGNRHTYKFRSCQ